MAKVEGSYEDQINWALTEESGISDLTEKMGNAAEMNLGAPFAMFLMALDEMSGSETVKSDFPQIAGRMNTFRTLLLDHLDAVVNRVNGVDQ